MHVSNLQTGGGVESLAQVCDDNGGRQGSCSSVPTVLFVANPCVVNLQYSHVVHSLLEHYACCITDLNLAVLFVGFARTAVSP